MGLNPGRRGEKPATNRLSYGEVSMYPVNPVPEIYARIRHNPTNVRYKLFIIVLINSNDILCLYYTDMGKLKHSHGIIIIIIIIIIDYNKN
jgi:hypothetical protein